MALSADGAVDGPARRITIGDLVIDAGLTLDAFRATSVGAAAPVILANEDWISWSVEADIEGEHWWFGLYFRGQDLMFVSFGGAGNNRFGDPWAPETEAARTAFHDAWLEQWELSGDDVWSGIDPKEGSAGIVVTYRR